MLTLVFVQRTRLGHVARAEDAHRGPEDADADLEHEEAEEDGELRLRHEHRRQHRDRAEHKHAAHVRLGALDALQQREHRRADHHRHLRTHTDRDRAHLYLNSCTCTSLTKGRGRSTVHNAHHEGREDEAVRDEAAMSLALGVCGLNAGHGRGLSSDERYERAAWPCQVARRRRGDRSRERGRRTDAGARGGRERGRPVEHEAVHGALEQTLD